MTVNFPFDLKPIFRPFNLKKISFTFSSNLKLAIDNNLTSEITDLQNLEKAIDNSIIQPMLNERINPRSAFYYNKATSLFSIHISSNGAPDQLIVDSGVYTHIISIVNSQKIGSDLVRDVINDCIKEIYDVITQTLNFYQPRYPDIFELIPPRIL